MTNWQTEQWIDVEDVKDLEYYDYWNDERQEQEKAWNITDGNFSKMENYLEESGLLPDLIESIKRLKNKYNYTLKGEGIDLAAGNLWAVPHLIKVGDIAKLYCLEYSRHRLYKIGIPVLEHYKVPTDKVVLVYGSFYDLKIKDNFLDFTLLSAAFHHAENPHILLKEIYRVLKPGGFVIIIGEHKINPLKSYLKYYVKALITVLFPENLQKKVLRKPIEAIKLFPKMADVLPPDQLVGDHYYSRRQYIAMFSQYNFEITQIAGQSKNFQGFLLRKR